MRIQPTLLLAALVTLSGCDVLQDLLKDQLETCGTTCAKIQACGVEPPVPTYGFGDDAGTGIAGLDCAAACANEDEREKLGYSNCQLECLDTVECGDMDACWDATSDVYAEFCDTDAPDVRPDRDEPYDNGSITGDVSVDDAVNNPAVRAAVEDSGFVIHFGDTPPTFAEGLYWLDWTIIEQNNARPVGTSNPHDICFWEETEVESVDVGYCQPGGLTVGMFLIGEGEDFTLIIVGENHEGFISGRIAEDESGRRYLVEVETLWVYLWASDSWELQDWKASWEAPVSQCRAEVADTCGG